MQLQAQIAFLSLGIVRIQIQNSLVGFQRLTLLPNFLVETSEMDEVALVVWHQLQGWCIRWVRSIAVF